MAMFLRKCATMLSYIKFNSRTQAYNLFQKNLCNVNQHCNFRSITYYTVLGVKPEATDEEIKEAYYSMSKKYHPDLNLGNKKAESKILEINEAFEVLGNKSEKEKYDNKMFPKVWEKESYIYDHTPRPEQQNFIFRRTVKTMSNAYDPYSKHRKMDYKKKRRHAVQKMNYNRSQSVQNFSKAYFKT